MWGLGDLRRKLNFPTRHKERRSDGVRLEYQVGEEDRTEDVPVEDHHGGFFLPALAPPSYLSGGPPEDLPVAVALQGKYHKPSMERLVERFGGEPLSVVLRYVDPIDLARMMAKIGYAFAVGCLGPDAFEEVYVLPTILEGPNAGQYIGCMAGPPQNNSPEFHQIAVLCTPRGEVLAYVRLFAQMNAPEYTVVVGRLRGATAQTDAA